MAWTNPETFTAGQTLTAASMNAIGGNLTASAYGNIVGRVERTTSYAVNQTAVGSAADIFVSDVTWTADGTTTYLVEFFCARSDTGANGAITTALVNSSGTYIAGLSFQTAYATSGTGYDASPILGRFWYTPSSGSVSLNVRATYNIAAGTLYFSTGSGTFAPGYLAVFGPA